MFACWAADPAVKVSRNTERACTGWATNLHLFRYRVHFFVLLRSRGLLRGRGLLSVGFNIKPFSAIRTPNSAAVIAWHAKAPVT